MYKTCSYIKYGLMRVIIKYLRSYMVGTIINNNIIFLELFSLCTRIKCEYTRTAYFTTTQKQLVHRGSAQNKISVNE